MTRQIDESPWWKGAVIYQIYPRSYQDTNGDGVGDLPGIAQRLDYIASLGVDGIWISPFFTSPMRDFGYDVADYCDVDPLFGDLQAFDVLLQKAHGLGLKVIIDQVYAHTSDDHAWFENSRQSRQSEYSDWYVWKDPKPDGTPPTNWQSVFGGAGWTWDARRQQYYMHNFLASQPQLNLHNPAVQEALLKVARFWLDRGVDGFRLDAINFSMFDPEFRDNPARKPTGVVTRPFDLQLHVHNQSHPDIPKFLERLRAVMNEYGAIFSVAEVAGPRPLEEMRAFTEGDSRLSSAYNFDFLYARDLTVARVRKAQEAWMGASGEGWPSWAFSNHDAPRCVTRWANGADRHRFAKLTNTLLLCLRGNPILYQGEELGLAQAEIPFERLQDPEAIANWPLTLGRDGARTPMPWQNKALSLGFSTAEPWLPFGADHAEDAVDAQDADDASVLNFTRQMIRLRHEVPALKTGLLRFRDTAEPLLSFERFCDGRILRCVFNLGIEDVALPPEEVDGVQKVLVSSGYDCAHVGTLPGHSFFIAEVS